MNQYKELYLFLTERCPNRCKYCYINYRNANMTEEDIDHYIAQYQPTRIIFFGGEPLERLDLMEYTVKKYFGKIKFQVVTSTCSNFKEFLSFNKEYPLNEVQLSWDGFTDSRVDQQGHSIAEKVYNNILYAMEQGLVFDIKTVVNNENIYDLSKLHDLFKRWKKEKTGANGQFVIAHGENYSEDFYKELKRQLPYTFDLDPRLYVEHMNKVISYLTQDEYCTCNIGKYTIIDPDGKENICTALSQYNINLGREKSQKRCTHPDCQKCKYFYLCDGGCRFERYLKFKDRWESNYLPCTCRIVKIYADTIKNFLDSLSPFDEQKLIWQIESYKRWVYDRNSEIQKDR